MKTLKELQYELYVIENMIDVQEDFMEYGSRVNWKKENKRLSDLHDKRDAIKENIRQLESQSDTGSNKPS